MSGKKKHLLIHTIQRVNMSNAISDLLSLLHEEWMPDDRREVIKQLLVDMVDRMEDSASMEDMR
jgi:hypothetical protein